MVEEMKVRMKLEPGKLKPGREIVEHPFGTMKRAFQSGLFAA